MVIVSSLKLGKTNNALNPLFLNHKVLSSTLLFSKGRVAFETIEWKL